MADGYVEPVAKTPRQESEGETFTRKSKPEQIAIPPKPFPYYPPIVSKEEMKRMEVMMELNKWANNDPFVAKRTAETLILLLADQFDINLVQLNP